MTPRYPLEDVRVLEIAGDIAGPYAGKLFVDAGADVVKVEPSSGDPLRTLSATAAPLAGDGALFQFLNAGKRSWIGLPTDPDVLRLAAGSDVVIVDSAVKTQALDELRAAAPAAVVVSITPWGRTGPWRELPANEFTLQAAAGSTGCRGTPEGRPLAAGGRLGEWVGGSYAAVAALAYARVERGEFIDVSLLEAMAITMGGLNVVSTQITGPSPLPSRFLELPSVEPTADGYVGFCTITAQQFADFLVLIERPDWLDDPDMRIVTGRVRRRKEFRDAVQDWTLAHTTAEIIEAASALRIPAVPIGEPATIEFIDQFEAREVFEQNPAGFSQPRPPYRISGAERRPISPAPILGSSTGAVAWSSKPSPQPERPPGDLPLEGLRVTDLTAFWAGPSATLLLASLGADVIKVEGVKRPDGMRFAAGKPPTFDGWWETGGMFLATNPNKRSLSLELTTPEGQSVAQTLVRASDIVIENFSVRVIGQLGLDWARVTAANPKAIMVRMPAFGLDGPWRDRVGFAQTMEQVSGLAWMTGEVDEPPVIPRGACDPIAGLHAVFAALVALRHREVTGQGSLVEVTMVEAALNIASPVVIERSAYGKSLHRGGNRSWSDAPQGVYPCAGDESWVAITVESDQDWSALRDVLDAGELLSSPALQETTGRRAAADHLDKVIESWTRKRSREHVVNALQAMGVTCAAVTLGPDLLAQPQLKARGFYEELRHPVAGALHIPGLPFKVQSRGARGWLRVPAPTFGQDNAEVLSAVCELPNEVIDQLARSSVIGDRPAGL